ncbi:histidine phosphatase family protein [Limosilactobacillus sp. RRLNB_1_1]|uniref:Histidine phosphatase family protein n=1 Tax=Limosilactobacillus albertensis TaxID=2759752 RepID=A0A7W3TS92_9LACO|nr:histidine phosphatase family protein [Limosilactobacillus albertensis]MBB1069947.1 histidine phosphatase family protein [Limosilactobacillus albertensis]MCD7117184.1 histidine phosphatase family protein [Limosilactobacillus albertensis]MCD7128788.1 histidine phosphatase family protein [Limosilactobacillus albertensis]
MTKIIVDVVRHGETFLNRLNRAQGWVDFELDERGRQQANATGEALKNNQYDAIVSSDLRRAIETREIIMSHLVKRPEQTYTDKLFREVFFGYFEGLDADANWRMIAHQNGYQDQDDIIRHESLEAGRNMMHDMDPTGAAESYEEVIARLHRGLRKLVKESQDGDRVLLVTHGTFIRTMANWLGVDTVGNFPTNAGLTTIEADEKHVKMIEYNHKFS